MNTIIIATDFSMYPAGRTREDGDRSGELFRDEFLVPLLKKHGCVILDLDGTIGYASNWLHEVFSGLDKKTGISAPELVKQIGLVSTEDTSLIAEIREYLLETLEAVSETAS